MKTKVRFSGFGGQGIIVAGVIYGHAATMDGKNSVQTQSYGSASRGGACKCDVIISDEEIYELEFPKPDILITLSQQAYDKYAPLLKEYGTLITEKDLVRTKKEHFHIYSIPATDIAFKKFGRKIMANIIVLGYMTALLDVVSKESVEKAIYEHVPSGTEEKNLQAFEEGYQLRIRTARRKGS